MTTSPINGVLSPYLGGPILHKTISISLSNDQIETLYYSIYRDHYGLSAIVLEGSIKPSDQECSVAFDYDFLLDHKKWSFCLMGIANNQVIAKYSGSVEELLRIKKGETITLLSSSP